MSRIHPVNERSPPAADGAIARANVIQIEVCLEADATTMAGAVIRLHAVRCLHLWPAAWVLDASP